MTDYESLKVAELRAILKDRGIPSTGLTRKAQIVARLQEDDAAAAVDPVASDAEATDTSTVEEPPDAPVPDATADAVSEPVAEPVAEPVIEPVAESSSAPVTERAPSPPPEPVLKPVELARPEATSPDTTKVPTIDNANPPSAQLSASQTPIPSHEEISSTQLNVEASQLALESQPGTDVDERKKRKRRSASPPLDTQEMAIKKVKYLGADPQSTQVQSQEVIMEDVEEDQGAQPSGTDQHQLDKTAKDDTQSSKHISRSDEQSNISKASKRAPKDGRFSNLLRSEESSTNVQPTHVDDLPTPPPSIHPATRAIYIRNLMRPLQASELRQHLLSLTSTPDSDPIEVLHLDSIKTHALVVLKTQAAAARIRAGTHEQIWPKERNRKALWSDYVPEEKVPGWIDAETGSGGGARSGGRKWEVVYEERQGEIVAEHQEVGSSSRPPPTTEQQDFSTRSAPQPSQSGASAAPPKPVQPKEAAKSFIALDKLFQSTKAKPMLYYKPVKHEIVDKRLDDLDALTSRNWSDKDYENDDEVNRYTFEDDKLVDGGKHYGPRGKRSEGRPPAPRGGRAFAGPPRGGGGGRGRYR